jgi:1,4-alpha-glucan branching enzyme
MKVITLLIVTSLIIAGCAVGGSEWKGSEKDVGPRIVDEGVEFSIYAPRAHKVCIAGDFNNWSKLADPLYDEDHDGVWKIVLPLKPGRYEYKFVIDEDRWIADPGNPHSVDDGFGGPNSVLIVKSEKR